MAYYVIKRTAPRPGYVAQPGSKTAYTSNIANARRYQTAGQADNDRCVENEVVVLVTSHGRVQR